MNSKVFNYKKVIDNTLMTRSTDVWTEGPMQKDGRMTKECNKLETLYCPNCPGRYEIGQSKLRTNKGHFSKLKCQACGEANSSRQWACSCGSLWTKCLRHMLWNPRIDKDMKRRLNTASSSTQGVDKPFPKRRKLHDQNFAIAISAPEPKRIRLNLGTKLAERFPHLAG